MEISVGTHNSVRYLVEVRYWECPLIESPLYFTEFQVPAAEGLHRGPEFSHNYLIDYTIGFIIINT